MALVSDEMMTALRAIGHQGLVTTVTIMRRMQMEGTGGEDDYETWVDVGEYEAWVKQNDRGPVLYDDGSGSMGAVGRYRIHFKNDVELYEGDWIIDGDEHYIINATNRGGSLMIFSTAIARKRD